MKTNIVLLIIIIVNIHLTSFGQVEKTFQHNGYSFKSFSIPLTKSEIAKIDLVSNSSNLNTTQFLDECSQNSTSSFFSCNASIEDSFHNPLGLFISQGREIKSLNLENGEGNFFLKPNGVIYRTANSIEIISSEKFEQNNSIVWAIQSGPLLLNSGTIHQAFKENSTNVNHRVGVGISVKNDVREVIFIISIDKVNLYTFASAFRDKCGCKNALCLESGRAFAHFPSQTNVNFNEDIVGNLFVYSDQKKTNQTASSNSKITVPLVKNSNNQYEIPVTLNSSISETCVFDSGINEVTLSTRAALALFEKGALGKSECAGTTANQYADGSIAFCDVFTIEEINIGGFLLKNITASISDSNDAHIRLGKSALQKMGKYNIDNVTHSLIIE